MTEPVRGPSAERAGTYGARGGGASSGRRARARRRALLFLVGLSLGRAFEDAPEAGRVADDRADPGAGYPSAGNPHRHGDDYAVTDRVGATRGGFDDDERKHDQEQPTGSRSARLRPTSALPRARCASGPTAGGSRPSTRRAATGASAAATSTRSSATRGRRAGGSSSWSTTTRACASCSASASRPTAAPSARRRAPSEGLAALGEEPPDLILLDVEMPQVDGWEMLRLVRERHGVESIPVVMYSGKVNVGSASEAEERGAQAFVGKPFDPEQLLASTRQLLRS